MARKPIQVECRGLQTPRERVWRAMLLAASGFTEMGVQDLCNPMVSITLVRDYCRDLERGGYLCRAGGGQPTNHGNTLTPIQYSVARRPREAPRVNRQGVSVSQGTAVLSMWRVMKVLKDFDFHDVAKAATLGVCVVKVSTAKEYVKALANAGYLLQVRPGKPGTATRWRLFRYTGPHAPAVTRLKTVFDRNTGEFSHLQSAQEVCDALSE